MGSPSPGDEIGRFVVEAVLSEGGAGVVVAARDPRLERRVAIRIHAEGEPDRLDREAQAMSRLRHPNVVSVYEVGHHDGRAYVAMELVGGGTLREAIALLPRRQRWRQVIALYAQAGRGLAAMHAAGLAHGAFNADNVLVDEAGDVKVTYGLPRDRGTSPPPPEQELTPAADQLAFCAALFDSLFDRTGDSLEDRRRVLAGRVAGDVPQWVVEVLRRGLAGQFAGMPVVLAELGYGAGDGQRRAGRVERRIFVITSGLMVAALTLTRLVLIEHDQHTLLVVRGIILFVVVGVVGWLGRGGTTSTRFNQQVFAVFLIAAGANLLLTVGCALMDVPADLVPSFQPLLIGLACASGAMAVDRRLIPATLAYFGAFAIALFAPVIGIASLIAHAILIVTLWFVFCVEPSP